ncbi:fibronectin type III domain-containing protein [Actinomadura craniellae]|uniref:fibronectin type III domain-containing protein n=1 Tax=Actinomadura craniellae TaxID=2231787 RepID=UPI0018F14635|nr:fibronectin type III domain-containing protein [Actinomadura craniellae]
MKASSGKIRAIAASAVLAGSLVGITGSGAAQAAPASLTLNYTCPFPLIGTQQISVRIQTDIPPTIGVGEQTPEIIVNTVTTVPDTATQGMALVGAKTLEGDALADSTIAAPGITLPVKVPAPLEKTNVPASGTFEVKATGKAPALTFTQPGSAKITVGNILLKLAPKDAAGGLTGLGEFDAPCTQVPGQNNLLATFQITDGSSGGDTQAPSAPGTPSVTAKTANSVSLTWGASTDNVGVAGYDVYSGTTLVASATGTSTQVANLTPGTQYSFTVKAKDAAGNASPASPPVAVTTEQGTTEPPPGNPPPPECGKIDSPGATTYACTYMSGFANAAKLGGAAIVNDPEQRPVLTNVAIRVRSEPPLITTDTDFQFVAPLRTRSTFLTFGFMPTVATMEMTQVGTGKLTASSNTGNGEMKVTATTKMNVRIYDAIVNGTPLDVGENCRMSQPIELTVGGGPPDYTNVLGGGVLRGSITYPPFRGCGVTENLDPVFTAAISGKGNDIKMTQGAVCMPGASTPPCVPPTPRR